MFAREHRLVAQRGVAIQFLPALRLHGFRHIAEHERDFVRDVQAGVGIKTFAGFSGDFQAVARKDHFPFKLAVRRERKRAKILFNFKGGGSETRSGRNCKMVLVGDNLDARGELERLKETAGFTERFQSGAAQLVGDEFGRALTARRPRHPAFERLGRQVTDLAAQVFNADLRHVADCWSERNTIVRRSSSVFLAGRCRQRVRRTAALRAGFDGRERRLLVPVSQKQLRRAVGCAARCPAKSFAIGRKNGQAIEAVREGHPNRFALARRIDDEQLEVGKAKFVRGKDNGLAGGMIIRRPGHTAKVSEAARVRAVEFHGVDVRVGAVGVEAAPEDALAVR